LSGTLQVISAGVQTSVQDGGRELARRYGVPRGGAMDLLALIAANRLVGNPTNAAALEISGGGAIFTLLRPTLLALAGADLGAELDGRPVRPWVAELASAGATLTMSARRGGWGARAYLALAGGIEVPCLLGARATYLAGGFGGFQGRALRAGDRLHTGMVPQGRWSLAGGAWPAHARPAYGATPTLRFIPGPYDQALEPDSLAALRTAMLRVGPTSNRIGYRLEGLQLCFTQAQSLPSFGVLPGAIQVPPDGNPILLMAEAQTVGGYPVVGVVITPDLPLAAQLLPGDSLRLAAIDQDEARAAQHLWASWLAAEPELDDWMVQLALSGELP
jgi:biotin-dependent carboxylase-like uncharacterized protein